ncbi:Gfo/Idh/MocA family oxidoreductase [Pirellulales bacterium]|nr:Gfo/Idh/MocA family oxidoreductase [Pirellulales bacterium]
MDRREFLKDNVIGAGTVSAAMSLGGSLSAELNRPSKKVYRVGIIGRTGRGNYGHGLDVVWKGIPHVAVAAVADDSNDGLAPAVKRTAAKKGYADYRKMLETEKLDIVAVCPRWIDRHHEMLLQAASHGCHVYMEKPFCRTLQECDEVIKAFERKNLKLAIAHVNRYRPELQIIRTLIKDGELGDILEIRSRGKEDGRGGGEDLWVLGSHVLDLMHAIAGGVDSCYATVTANGRPVTKSDVYDGDEGIGPLAGDGIEAVYRFKNGVTGFFASHRDQRGDPSRFAIQVFGSEGVIEFPSGGPVHVLKDSSWASARSNAKWLRITSGGVDKPALNNGQPHGNEAAVLDLIDAIETDRQPISGMYEARAATEMIVSAFESHRTGGPVEFPLTNRKNPLTML